MSTTPLPAAVAPPAVVPAQDGPAPTPTAGRVLPRVDLLPPELVERRTLRRTGRWLAVASAAVLLVIVLACVAGAVGRAQAADALAVTQARTAELTAQQARYQEVPRTLAAVRSTEDALAAAMARDVLWHRYLAHLAQATPRGVWLTQLTATTAAPVGAAGAPAAAPPAEAGEAAPDARAAGEAPVPVAPGSSALAAPGGVGTLTVLARGQGHPDTASWLQVLDTTPGLRDATFSSSERALVGSTPVIDITSAAVITTDALSRRYDRGAP